MAKRNRLCNSITLMRSAFAIFILLLSCMSPLSASTHGYLSDVQAEREQRFYEIFLFAEPPPRIRPLRELIFNPELSREFKNRYLDRFGQVDTESMNYQRTDFGRLELNKGKVESIESQTSVRRSFAEYMMKRLAEWHLDNYIKSEPSMRPVYEAKEKLKKVEVRVNKQTKLEGRYSLAGNILDVILENPYCDSKWTIEMDPSSFGPGPIEESKLTLGRLLTSKIRFENIWSQKEGRSRFDLIRHHTQRLTTSYGVSGAFKKSDFSGESRLALALNYTF